MIYDKHKALINLKPNTDWSWKGYEYSDLKWEDSSTKPTEAEIDAEVIRLQADYDGKEYQRNRAAEYPSVVDQLDDIYHNGLDAWKATIKATKDKYPKP